MCQLSKKIHHLEHTQYAFLKTLVFSDIIKIEILLNTHTLAPLVPIPIDKLYRTTFKVDRFLVESSIIGI